MGSEWALVSIEDLQADTKGAITIGPFGSRMKSDCYVEAGVPVIRGTNISDGPSFKSDFVFITEEMANTLGSCNVFEDDLVFPHRGSIGEVGIVPSGKRYVISSSLMKLTCNQDIADPAYLYYFFKSAKGRYELLKNASQVGTPGIGQPLTSLKSITLPLPPIAEQQSIAGFLKILDEKIELNRQMNTTLEAMAQALFKSWFVDFDPVIDNALAAGNPIPEELAARAERRAKAAQQPSPEHPHTHTLPAAIRQQFPNQFVFTETMGWVPEGWDAVTLSTLTSKIGSGSTPRGGSQVYVEDGVSLIRSQNVYDSKFVWEGLAHITDEAATQLKGVTVLEGDVLMNITGASILRTCIVSPEALPARVNQHVAIIRPRPDIPSKYLHLYLLNANTKNYLMGQNAGASREAVTKSHIESVPILDPGAEILAQFAKLISSFQDCAENCNSTVRTLSALRDRLLPKLLSGQLRIPEAEQLLAEAL